MSFILKGIWKECIKDIRNQYRCPTKSLIGGFFTRYWSKANRPLVYATINQLKIKPSDFILEVGYGRGDGIAKVLELLDEGDGAIFGLESSSHMSKLAVKRFTLEIMEENNKLVLDDLLKEFLLFQYPNNFFDGIYHVDVFYFWQNKKMFDICDELFRILKPGGKMVCGMDIKRLKKFEKWQILDSKDTDPLRYIQYLEPVGFTNVQLIYKKIDSKGNATDLENAKEIQLIVAEKPVNITEEITDGETIMERLEKEIKDERLSEYLMEIGPQTKILKKKIKDVIDLTQKP